mmetsp:Transcript_40174/g.72136  ORF Transcript_40174/g.72136 Transcript_40174/m.72136 type:complete len:285 (-) Transcript_40174:240-1094(-)
MIAILMPDQRLAFIRRRRFPRCLITKRACPDAARLTRISPFPRSFHVLLSSNSYSVASAAKPFASSSSPVTCFSSERTEGDAVLVPVLPKAGAEDASAVDPKILGAGAAEDPNTDCTEGKRLPSVDAGVVEKEKAAAEAAPSVAAAGVVAPVASVVAGELPPARPPDCAALATNEEKPEAVLLAAAAKAKGLVLAAAPKDPKRGADEVVAAALPSFASPSAGFAAVDPKSDTPEKGLGPPEPAPPAFRFTEIIFRVFSTSSEALANGPLGSSSSPSDSGSSCDI